MSFTEFDIEAAHKHSIFHRSEVEQSDVCGCFYCCETAAPLEIVRWTDEDRTALCPHCDIDSVIGSASGFPVSDPAFLGAMNRRWFDA